MLFPSEQWVAAWVELCNADEPFRQASAGWDGVAGCEIRTVGTVGAGGRAEYLFLRLVGKDGHWNDHELGPDPGLVDGSMFVLSADFPVWRAVIEQQTQPIRAMIQGRVRVRGQLSSVLRWHRPLVLMTQLAGRLPTEFSAGDTT